MRRSWFIVFFLTAPLFISILFSLRQISIDKFKSDFESKQASVFEEIQLAKINNMRTLGGERVFFNKGTLLGLEVFEYTNSFSPRKYFNEKLIPYPFFIFFVFGVYKSLKKKDKKTLYLLLSLAIAPYLFGKTDLVYIFPIALLYLWITLLGVPRKLFKFVIIINIFFVARLLWLGAV